MAKKNLKVKVDTINGLYKPEGTIKQLDSVFFNIEVTEEGEKKDLTGQTIKLFARKSDGKMVEQSSGISITNAEQGKLTIDLLNAAVQTPGYVYFELEISDSNGIISTADFVYRVIPKVGSDEAIESTNEVSTLKEIEVYVAQAKQEIKEFKKLQDKMLKTNETINANEIARVNAENIRSQAEEERVAAETKREEGFNTFESRISANRKELKNARTATTGEKFNSLDERIDCEVDRLNRKIEVSFLQQEDKENHVIENSIEGMTTDMVIKGRTLQNLFISENVSLIDDASCSNGVFDWNVNETSTLMNYKKMQVEDGVKYTIICNVIENTLSPMARNTVRLIRPESYGCEVFLPEGFTTGIFKTSFTTNKNNAGRWDDDYANIYMIGTTGRIKFSLVVIKGDINFIPTHFEGIKSFGQQEDKISILSGGLNRCTNESINGFTNINVNNAIQPDTTAISYIAKVYKGGTYYLNKTGGDRSVLGYFKSYPKIGDVALNVASGSIIVPSHGYIVAYVSSNKNTNNPTNIMISENASADFQPYQEDKKDILLQDLGFDEGLRGLNLTVYDELNNIRNVAIKRVDKYKLTGEEEIYTEETIAENNMKFVITTKGTSVKPSGSVISDNFIKGNDTVSNSVRLATNNKVIINIDKTKLSEHSVEGFKTWLKANPTTIYYELAEPVETPLSENINLKTFGEKTYVSFENAISGTSSFKAPINAAATISRLNRENRALEEENKTLRQDFESTTLSLTDSDLELVKQNVDIDFRLMEVEFALDIQQATLSSNINLKNKKGEVKSMARTPYEMLKIVILSGDYDREDYIHKVGKYYERGRMTKEEHDELMSLMTADEVISK